MRTTAPLLAPGIVSLVVLFSGCAEDDPAVLRPEPSRELVAMGSFETPVVRDTLVEGFASYTATTKLSNGWTVQSVDLVHRKLWPAASGNQSIDLNAAGPGSIAMRMDTKEGSRYVLAFSFATNPASDLPASPETRRFRIVWNQVAIDTLDVPRTSPIAWRRHSLELMAIGKDSLRLESISDGRAGVAIDSISLQGP